MFGTDIVNCPFETVAVVDEIAVGAVTAVVRPDAGVDSSVTRTLEPSAPRPVSRTEFVPASSPKTTSKRWRVESYEAKPSMPDWAGGVVVTIEPAMSPYHLYSHHVPVGWLLLTTRPLTVPYSNQKARSAAATPARSNFAM